MYLKQTPQKSGRIYLSIVENYYDKEKKYSRQTTLEKLGYLDELKKTYGDPIAHFNEKVKKMKNEKILINSNITFEFSKNDKLTINKPLRKNFGYSIISKIYHQLRIHTFIVNRQRHSKELYDANAIMKMLTFQRLLAPASKKKTYENKDYLFENCNFSIDDVYRSLSFFSARKDALLLWLHEHVQKLYGRDSSLVYYDVTNFYFEIDGPEGFIKKKKGDQSRKPDGFRKKGVSKEHRPDPIIQMGLFVDNNNLPITYELFPGNTNDCMTYRPVLSQIKRKFGIGRAVVVADKAMCTGDNIWYTLSAKDGYVFSTSVRKADAKTRSYILDESGYEQIGGEYKRKSRKTPRNIYVTSSDGSKLTKIVHEKHVIFYSEKYDKRAKAERAPVLAKAKDMLENPGNYTRATSYGAAAYLKNVEFDKKTGEILNTGKKLEFDSAKLHEQEEMDGYYIIVTSEMSESDDRIIEMYRGLWKIEETFRVSKSELESRPVFVSNKEHIEAHFLICFISLLIVRILETALNHRFAIGEMLNSLSNAQCVYLQQNFYLFDYYDDVLKVIGDSFDIDFSKKIRTLGEIKNILADSKK